MTYRLAVTGSREYDDGMSLRAALDQIFDEVPSSDLLVVMCALHDDPVYQHGADVIAAEWAREAAGQGLAVTLEKYPPDWEGPCRSQCGHGDRASWNGRSICPWAGIYSSELMCASAIKVLAALRTGTRSTGARNCLMRAAGRGISIQLVVQGDAAGLPADLLRPRTSRL